MRRASRKRLLRARREQVAWAASLLDLQSGESVLNLRCESGRAALQIGTYAPGVWLVGVDPAEEKLRRARERCAGAIEEGRLSLYRATAEALPFPDSRFDKIMLIRVGRFPALSEEACREARRVLKPRGRIAVVQWPISPYMLDAPLQAAHDSTVQRCGDALRAQLTEAGYGRVRLHFKPSRPVASVCAVAVREKGAPRCFAPPLDEGFWW